MSPTAGFLIYSGIMPLVKTFITIGLGYVIAWKGLFPPQAARGASQIAMNIALPCLMFSSMVPAFNNDNVSAIGPLLLLSVVYMFLGFLGGAIIRYASWTLVRFAVLTFIIREIFYVPRNFWQGLVVLVCPTRLLLIDVLIRS